ncbi:Nucleic acid-binding OB-fold [Arabidopsis thaliana x Arabidopsis arenosa]|uniref:Nucleic acid-binding OB-fold n=1 Tax=Arabidopsis thaliana x Arabidopsis arenosa TaxID=1240361 RepID=A0A8T2A4U2_9BRAS|nr:Nucleic acid-binding OB-fold [Arabidopsis thaliana x Arabidopsis arenosa]
MSSRFTSSSIERYNDFSRLNPAIVGWHVHVKVLRRFHTDDYISKGGLGLLLVDDKGNQIEALICSPLTSHYSTFIEEDEFYTIMNFRVVENSGFTKLTRSDFKIMFYDGTIVKEASSFSQDDYIVATPFGAIFNGYHDTSYLITLIGRIVEASDLTNVTDEPSVIGGYRYSFTIEDQEYDFFHRWKKTLKCCAYGEVAIECHDRFRNVIGTDVTCVLRWWKVYQLLDGWRHVRIYSHPPYSNILVKNDADNVEHS